MDRPRGQEQTERAIQNHSVVQSLSTSRAHSRDPSYEVVDEVGCVTAFGARDSFRSSVHHDHRPTPSDTMAPISSKTFTVAEHTPEDGEYRATRRFLVNPDCLKPFKLSAGEVVAIVGTQDPDTAVSGSVFRLFLLF